MQTPDDLTGRAFAAWFRRFGDTAAQPASDSGPERLPNGRTYVVLRNVRGVMAVYSVRKDGGLRWMDRWPKAVA